MSYGKRISWLEQQKGPSISTQDFKNIILFDMDGTLTPPREPFELTLLSPLRELSNYATLGIVSGSDYDYIMEQMDYVFHKSELKYSLHLLPCNGTKWYTPPSSNEEGFQKNHEVNMKSHLGDDIYHKLISVLLGLQYHISALSIPLSGEFIQYRGSMVNWCPIGRSAESSDRKTFTKLDKRKQIRKTYLKMLRKELILQGLDEYITCSLGGDTSFDIYPTGWDKTYALRHFEGYDVWFVGDRCEKNGNDRNIYDALRGENKSYKTKGPNQTREIIMNIVDILKMENVLYDR